MSSSNTSKFYISHGRNIGKSIINQMVQQLTQPSIKELDQAIVDGETWHTVKLNIPTAHWLREQDQTLWHEHSGYSLAAQNAFDVHEKLYTLMALKWQ